MLGQLVSGEGSVCYTVLDLNTHLDGSWELADSLREEKCQEVIPDAAHAASCLSD